MISMRWGGTVSPPTIYTTAVELMRSNSVKIVRRRLARIEGQVRGLMQMVEADREGKEVLIQLSAVRAALDSVGSIVIAEHVEELAGTSELTLETRTALNAMIKTFLR